MQRETKITSIKFHKACSNGDLEFVNLCLEKPDIHKLINLNYNYTLNKNTPLMISLLNKHYDISKALINYHYKNPQLLDINLKNKHDLYPTIVAMIDDNFEIFRMLFNSIEFISEHPESPKNVISQASFCKSPEYMKLLIQREDINLNYQDNFNLETPLIFSMHRENWELTKLLLNDPRVNINEKSLRNDRSPLMVCCYMRTIEIFKMLVQRKDLNLNDKNSDNETVLHLCLTHYLEMTENVIELDGIDLNKTGTQNEETAIHIAVRLENHKIFNLLMDKNVDVNKKDKHGKTLLMDVRNIDMLKRLLEIDDLDVNSVSFYGDSFILYAVNLMSKQHLEIALSSYHDFIFEYPIKRFRNDVGFSVIVHHVNNGLEYQENLDLTKEYLDNKEKVRMRLRLKYGYSERDSAKLFSILLLLKDDLIKKGESVNDGLHENKLRFVNIIERMPNEIIMKLCNGVYGNQNDFIKQDLIDEEIKKQIIKFL